MHWQVCLDAFVLSTQAGKWPGVLQAECRTSLKAEIAVQNNCEAACASHQVRLECSWPCTRATSAYRLHLHKCVCVVGASRQSLHVAHTPAWCMAMLCCRPVVQLQASIQELEADVRSAADALLSLESQVGNLQAFCDRLNSCSAYHRQCAKQSLRHALMHVPPTLSWSQGPLLISVAIQPGALLACLLASDRKSHDTRAVSNIQ